MRCCQVALEGTRITYFTFEEALDMADHAALHGEPYSINLKNYLLATYLLKTQSTRYKYWGSCRAEVWMWLE